MKSLDNLDKYLFAIAPVAPAEPPARMAVPVMATIRRQAARRVALVRWSLIVGLLVLVAATSYAVARGNAGKVISMAVAKLGTVATYPRLYFNATVETLPWAAIAATAALLLAAYLLAKHRGDIVRHAGRAAAITAGTLLISASASAATLTTATATPGPAQQQLERAVNGVGKAVTTINGKDFESTGSLTDKQAYMVAEQDALRQAALSVPIGKTAEANDPRQGGCECTVITVTDKILQVNYMPTDGQKPDLTTMQTFNLTDKTLYYDSINKVSKLNLKPGDGVTVLPDTSFQNAAVVMLMKFPLADYSDQAWNVTSLKSAHRADGKCFNNETDQCPDLSEPVNLMSIYDGMIVPDGAEVREAYGQITALTDNNMELTNPSGSVWKFNIGLKFLCCSLGQVDSGFRLGYYVRVEFWQMKNDLANRTIFDEYQSIAQMDLSKGQAQQLLAEGKISLYPKIPLRAVQYVTAKPYVTPSASPRP